MYQGITGKIQSFSDENRFYTTVENGSLIPAQ